MQNDMFSVFNEAMTQIKKTTNAGKYILALFQQMNIFMFQISYNADYMQIRQAFIKVMIHNLSALYRDQRYTYLIALMGYNFIYGMSYLKVQQYNWQSRDLKKLSIILKAIKNNNPLSRQYTEQLFQLMNMLYIVPFEQNNIYTLFKNWLYDFTSIHIQLTILNNPSQKSKLIERFNKFGDLYAIFEANNVSYFNNYITNNWQSLVKQKKRNMPPNIGLKPRDRSLFYNRQLIVINGIIKNTFEPLSQSQQQQPKNRPQNNAIIQIIKKQQKKQLKKNKKNNKRQAGNQLNISLTSKRFKQDKFQSDKEQYHSMPDMDQNFQKMVMQQLNNVIKAEQNKIIPVIQKKHQQIQKGVRKQDYKTKNIQSLIIVLKQLVSQFENKQLTSKTIQQILAILNQIQKKNQQQLVQLKGIQRLKQQLTQYINKNRQLNQQIQDNLTFMEQNFTQYRNTIDRLNNQLDMCNLKLNQSNDKHTQLVQKINQMVQQRSGLGQKVKPLINKIKKANTSNVNNVAVNLKLKQNKQIIMNKQQQLNQIKNQLNNQKLNSQRLNTQLYKVKQSLYNKQQQNKAMDAILRKQRYTRAQQKKDFQSRISTLQSYNSSKDTSYAMHAFQKKMADSLKRQGQLSKVNQDLVSKIKQIKEQKGMLQLQYNDYYQKNKNIKDNQLHLLQKISQIQAQLTLSKLKVIQLQNKIRGLTQIQKQMQRQNIMLTNNVRQTQIQDTNPYQSMYDAVKIQLDRLKTQNIRLNTVQMPDYASKQIQNYKQAHSNQLNKNELLKNKIAALQFNVQACEQQKRKINQQFNRIDRLLRQKQTLIEQIKNKNGNIFKQNNELYNTIKKNQQQIQKMQKTIVFYQQLIPSIWGQISSIWSDQLKYNVQMINDVIKNIQKQGSKVNDRLKQHIKQSYWQSYTGKLQQIMAYYNIIKVNNKNQFYYNNMKNKLKTVVPKKKIQQQNYFRLFKF